MIELTTLSLAQITLIGIGALFQVLALCSAVPPSDSTNRTKNSKDDESDADEEGETGQPFAMQAPTMVYQTYDDMGMRPGDLMNTAKLTFSQSFKNRHKVSQAYIES
jgi:hypothetical protein